ncbi:UNVERIFIED_CONTAM: hypothetical protein FKN15_051994 [Acipenser sinensis]
MPAGNTSPLPLPPPPAEGEYLLVPPPPQWEDCWPLPPPPAEGEYLLVPPPPGAEEQELPLPPPLPGAEEQELPLLPVPLPQGVQWPEPQKGELPATKKGEGVWRPLTPAAVSVPELMGEVRRPAPTAALSLQEVLWPEPHHVELPATKKGEVGGPPTPAAFPLPGLSQLKESVMASSSLATGNIATCGPLEASLPILRLCPGLLDF